MCKKLDKLFPNWHKFSTFICVNYVILIFKIKVIHVNFIPELSISRQYMSKLKIKLTKLWTGLAGNYTKNLGDFLSSLTTGDSNTNPYWKIERKKGRTISSLHLQCHNLSLSLSFSLKQWAFWWEALAFYTLPSANLAFFLLLLLLLLLNPCSCILAQEMQRQRRRTLLQWLLCTMRTQTTAFT